ncbi:MAG TPA: hypothetical protein VGI80_02050 [Pyrinomonadaceae bacterium]|jgi:hypothetical protein
MRIIFAIGVVCLGLSIVACSGSSPDGANFGSGPAASPGNSAASSNADTGSANAGEPIQNAGNRFDPIKGRRRPPAVVTSESPPALDFRPAPENSETATTMNDHGQPVEVRVFKDNTRIDRVEAVWLGANDKLLKITMRNGNTVEVKTDRVASLATAPSDLLVELAGGPK